MLREMFFLMISVRIGLIKWMDWRNLLDIMNIMVDGGIILALPLGVG